MAKKLKPILPTLREKKRYLAFEIISKSKIKEFSGVSGSIWAYLLSFIGELGAAKAGIWVLSDKYNPETQRGVIKVSHRYVNELKSAIAFIDRIAGQEVIVRSLCVSGMLNKASSFTGAVK